MTDAEACFRWISDPDVARLLGLVRLARSLEQERAWIAGVLADRDYQRVFVVADENGQAIGTCSLRGIDRRERTALLGIMIGEKTLWDRGYGTAATRALLEYAFTALKLREVRLSCHPENHRALRCYEKAGFRRGTEASDSDGPRRREVRMAIARERWKALRTSGREVRDGE